MDGQEKYWNGYSRKRKDMMIKRNIGGISQMRFCKPESLWKGNIITEKRRNWKWRDYSSRKNERISINYQMEKSSKFY